MREDAQMPRSNGVLPKPCFVGGGSGHRLKEVTVRMQWMTLTVEGNRDDGHKLLLNYILY